MEEIEDIIKIVKSLEVSDLLIESISETMENKSKEQKRGLGVSLLRNLLAGKKESVKSGGQVMKKPSEWRIIARKNF